MRRALGVAALTLVTACTPGADAGRVARSTLVIGIDVSGSFKSRDRYDNAIDFASNYLYAHIHGLGGLKQPTAVFVGSFGGEKPGETKSFQPIHTFQNMSVPQIAAFLRKEYPSNDGLTDFNPFFERVGTLVKRQNLVLSPLNIVMLTDGIPDTRSEKRGNPLFGSSLSGTTLSIPYGSSRTPRAAKTICSRQSTAKRPPKMWIWNPALLRASAG